MDPEPTRSRRRVADALEITAKEMKGVASALGAPHEWYRGRRHRAHVGWMALSEAITVGSCKAWVAACSGGRSDGSEENDKIGRVAEK